MFLGKHDLNNTTPMNREALKQLWTMTDSLRMLNNDPNLPGAGPIGDLDPITGIARLGRQVDTKSGYGVATRVFVELRDEQVVVFHAERELLHVYIVQVAVLAAE